MSKREYVKEGLTILWDSDLCIHCEECFSGLPQVFNPKVRPWVNINGATTSEIISQVEKCPSQALKIK